MKHHPYNRWTVREATDRLRRFVIWMNAYYVIRDTYIITRSPTEVFTELLTSWLCSYVGILYFRPWYIFNCVITTVLYCCCISLFPPLSWRTTVSYLCSTTKRAETYFNIPFSILRLFTRLFDAYSHRRILTPCRYLSRRVLNIHRCAIIRIPTSVYCTYV